MHPSVQEDAGPAACEPRKLSITAIILTFNEQLHIERCLTNLADLVEQVIVVDSFSTDRTVELARRLGAEVLQRPFKHQADQFGWALVNTEARTDWVLKLDADEYLEPALKSEIRAILPFLPPGICGINLKRKMIFRDRWIRFGGYYPAILLRLWRTGTARIEQRWMDEHAVLTRGASITLKGDFVDHNLNDITFWTEKHNRYATRQMVELINREHSLFPKVDVSEASPYGRQRWKRFLRNRMFGGAPVYLRSVVYFLYRYFVRLGFLDGKEGFVFHVLHGFWYFVLIDAKIEDARRFVREHGVQVFKEHLRQRHRIEI